MLFFTLKIKIVNNFMSRSVKAPTRTLLSILTKFGLTCSKQEEIQDLGEKNAVFHLRNWNKKKNVLAEV